MVYHSLFTNKMFGKWKKKNKQEFFKSADIVNIILLSILIYWERFAHKNVVYIQKFMSCSTEFQLIKQSRSTKLLYSKGRN